MNKSYIPHAILISGVTISAAVIYHWDIGLLEKIFSIIGSLSLGVALFTYFYKKKQDEMLATIGQITFFREKIIPEWESVVKAIKAKDVNKQYWFSRIEINKHDLASIKEERSRNFENQLKIFFDSTQEDQSLWLDEALLSKQVFLLNLLEEFSLTISHFKINEQTALNSVKGAYVEIIEKNAVALLFMKDVLVGDHTIYQTALSLYDSWKEFPAKPKFIKNLAKYDLISKEQKEKIYDIKRENSKLKIVETKSTSK